MRLKRTIPALPVVNVAKAILFYESKLGFKARHQEKYFAILVRDGIELHLWAACDKSWKFMWPLKWFRPIWSGAESFIAGTASCRIEVEGINDFYKEFKQNSVLHSPDTVVVEQYWGDTDFSVVDNYGNLITLFEKGDEKNNTPDIAG